MVGLKRREKEEKIKILIMTFLIVISVISTYYFHLAFHTSVMFTHFFYVPIILACIWWKRKGIWIAIFLAANLMFSHVFYRWNMVDTHDILRSIMFIVVAILVVELREKNEQAEEQTRVQGSEAHYLQRIGHDCDRNMLRFKGTVGQDGGRHRRVY